MAVDDVIINEVTVRNECSDFDDDDDREDDGGDVGVVSISSNKGNISNNGRIDNDVNESFTEELLSFQQHFTSAEAIDCSCGKMFKQHKVGHKNARLDLNKIIVSCEKCGSCQHAGCVGYDLTDESRGSYLCPHCYVTEIPIPSGATLIITPNSIIHQWLDEVLKHVADEAIKLFVYKGVQRQGYIQPRVLARQDIVLTTYETLRAEMKYVGLLHNKFDENNKLRYNKKFISFPTPLVALEWWRVCLDEAQMVEKVSTKPADMACRLVSQIRWCITGTPIQRSFDDLYGLLSFLRACPYDDRTLWSKFMQGAYEGGLREHPCWVISRLLWRNCKRDVIDQINLPPQSIKTHLLTFSPVEEHFYRRMYQKCSDEALTDFIASGLLHF
ncbi:hypothetical protein HELRODRAFT_174102 [Helobdella robusta]|uniref:Zinc finger PHD-type domain-containing protein n=1 Tax=Helobdella robusta TaxID=6412 RepID=T1F7L7_HELRO|nr:hypothetical protein HELRODRAFT_174102 [Helobdella robusta]ESO03203.1 hypothetical protein HELRODRAFT_174102 [Helobdella robusta]